MTTLHLDPLRDRADVLVFEAELRRVTTLPLTAHLVAQLDGHKALHPFDLALGGVPDATFQPLSDARETVLTVVVGPRDLDCGGFVSVHAGLHSMVAADGPLPCRAVFRRRIASRQSEAECIVPVNPHEFPILVPYFTAPARITVGTIVAAPALPELTDPQREVLRRLVEKGPVVLNPKRPSPSWPDEVLTALEAAGCVARRESEDRRVYAFVTPLGRKVDAAHEGDRR